MNLVYFKVFLSEFKPRVTNVINIVTPLRNNYIYPSRGEYLNAGEGLTNKGIGAVLFPWSNLITSHSPGAAWPIRIIVYFRIAWKWNSRASLYWLALCAVSGITVKINVVFTCKNKYFFIMWIYCFCLALRNNVIYIWKKSVRLCLLIIFRWMFLYRNTGRKMYVRFSN